MSLPSVLGVLDFDDPEHERDSFEVLWPAPWHWDETIQESVNVLQTLLDPSGSMEPAHVAANINDWLVRLHSHPHVCAVISVALSVLVRSVAAPIPGLRWIRGEHFHRVLMVCLMLSGVHRLRRAVGSSRVPLWAQQIMQLLAPEWRRVLVDPSDPFLAHMIALAVGWKYKHSSVVYCLATYSGV